MNIKTCKDLALCRNKKKKKRVTQSLCEFLALNLHAKYKVKLNLKKILDASFLTRLFKMQIKVFK